MLNIGINVIETDGKTAPALAGAQTSVAGLLLRSRRGPTTGTVRISKFGDFIGRFGAHSSAFPGAHCVEGFFLNGGQQAYVARVVGAGAGTASVTLKDRAGADALEISAGYRGNAELGAWGNELYVDVRDNPEFSTRLLASRSGNQPARLVGNAIGASVDLTTASPPARQLQLEIDQPATNIVITFDATTIPVLGAATAQDVAAAINTKAGARVLAEVVSGGVRITSRSKGASSRVRVSTGVDDPTRTLLGFPDGNITASGAAAPAGTYDRLQVASIAGLSIGQQVRLADGLTTDWHAVTQLVAQDDGAGNTEYFVVFAEPAAAQRNEYRVEDAASLSTVEFDLVVKQQIPADPRPGVVETWEKLTLDPAAAGFAETRINNVFSGSTYITVDALSAGVFSGQHIPAAISDVRLGLSTPATSSLPRTQGADGGAPAVTAYTSAFGRFDTVAIQLLSVLDDMPDGALSAVTRAGIDYCASAIKGDCMFVGATPSGRDQAGAKAFGQDFRASKVYGALYWPWISVTDPASSAANPVRLIPPTGHILGVYARTDQTRGIWKAPAGNEATIRGALSVATEITDADHTDLVKNGSVNAVRRLPGVGLVIDSSRTLSTDNRWQYVNVRLLFNYVKASLRDGLRWVKQEPNTESLWRKIKYNAVTPFLLGLYQEGAFGPGKPGDAFTVIVGPENNPPDQVALGNLKIEVYFYPSRPAETILIVVGQQDNAAMASEA